MKQDKYVIHCPKCKTTFDVSHQLTIWQKELYEEIDKLIKKIKEKEIVIGEKLK